MTFICTRCGRDALDHTGREMTSGSCVQPLPEPNRPRFTATGLGLVNPEALENTGEVFELHPYKLVMQNRIPLHRLHEADAAERGQ